MHHSLRAIFEAQVSFRTADGEAIDGPVLIGETPILAVEVLRDDSNAYGSEFNNWLHGTWLPFQREQRERLLEVGANAARYADLIGAFRRRQVVPLVGSGMSVPSGCPTWSNLLRAVRQFTTVETDLLEKMIAEAAFEEAADHLAAGTNSRLFNERIEHLLRVADVASIDGPVRLIPALFPNLVLTTNLDDILEQLSRDCGQAFTHVLAGYDLSRYRQMKSPTEQFLLKLHGDGKKPETRVLLSEEYNKAYAPGGIAAEELALLYRTTNLLFLGCSLGPDRTVRVVADVASQDAHMPRHYAFLPMPETEDALLARELFLSERGIYAIWYKDDHDSSLTALLAGMLEEVESA